jgi:hypothetical protein
MTMSPFETTTPNALFAALLAIGGGDGERETDSGTSNNSAGGSSDSGGKDSGESKDSDKSDGDDDKDKPDERDEKIKELEKKADDEKKARIKLERERDKELESKNAENENVEAERDDYKQKYEKLLKYVENDALVGAIARNSKFDFHDPKAVLNFIDKNNIRLDLDKGDIDGLDLEIKRIAKDNPWMLKPTAPPAGDGDKQDQQDNQNGGGSAPPSGNHPFGGTSWQRETDKTKLGSKYNIPGFRGASNIRPA